MPNRDTARRFFEKRAKDAVAAGVAAHAFVFAQPDPTSFEIEAVFWAALAAFGPRPEEMSDRRLLGRLGPGAVRSWLTQIGRFAEWRGQGHIAIQDVIQDPEAAFVAVFGPALDEVMAGYDRAEAMKRVAATVAEDDQDDGEAGELVPA